MATLKPFRALRPSRESAEKVSAVPYDVVNTDEARQLAAGNPLSFLHVSRAEIDLPDGTDPYSDAVYAKALENFQSLKHMAPMIVEDTPSLYLYKLKMGPHEQTGIAGCCSVAEYDNDVVRKHERTRKDKEDDRTRHILTLRAQTGPVFLTYKSDPRINETVAECVKQPPVYDFTASDGVQHTAWRIPDSLTDRLVDQFGEVPLLYIADGHHRAASASRAAAELKGKDKDTLTEYGYFLAVLFPSDQVQILSYNRTVKDLNGLSKDQFLAAVAERFVVQPDPAGPPAHKGQINMYIDGGWYGLTRRPDAARSSGEPTSSLDVAVLQDLILEPVLGIKDIRTDKRIDFVGGIRGAEALKSAVDDGRAAVAFLMFPVTVDDLIAVSNAGLIMPPKSTWFEPKLRDGLLSHLI